MKRFQVQQVDEKGNVVQESVSDDVLLEELAERTKQIDDTIRDSEEPEAPLAESSVGTVIILTKVKGPRAEYVTEIYPGKMGAEPFKGAGTGFYAGGAYYRTSDEGKSWRNLRLKAANPVEIGEKDVRTLPLPYVAPAQAEAMAEPLPEAYGGAAGCGATAPGAGKMLQELAEAAGGPALTTLAVPGLQEPKKPEPRHTLDVAIERYGNLDVGIQRFLVRLDSWVVSGDCDQRVHDDVVLDVVNAWNSLGVHLHAMAKENTTIKVTNRSRRDAWMRPGAEVSLRDDVLQRFGAVYAADVLENLSIRAATESDVFLVSGERELGLVAKAHIVKRGQRGKSEASTAK